MCRMQLKRRYRGHAGHLIVEPDGVVEAPKFVSALLAMPKAK